MKKRLLYYQISKYFDHKNAIVITGMRQVGKTTLMKQIFEEIRDKPRLWFDFDNPLDQKIFEDIEYRNIYKRLERLAGSTEKRLFVFIDEIQNFPEITKVIKFLIDHYEVKFFVTGSSSFYLRNLFPESLAGRKFLYELAPLSFREILFFQDKVSLADIENRPLAEVLSHKNLIEFKSFEEDFQTYLTYGGFPEVVTTSDYETKKAVLKNIFGSFFEKELRILADYKHIRELRDLILLLAPRVGSLLDISKIASELGVDRAKIYEYLEFLQGTFFLRLLPKFSKSIDRSVAGGRKVYFADTGLLYLAGEINRAAVLENAVINQLSHYGELSFYNKRNTAEIDVILDKKIAFEVKTQATSSDCKRLEKLANSLSLKQFFVISQNYNDLPKVIFPQFL